MVFNSPSTKHKMEIILTRDKQQNINKLTREGSLKPEVREHSLFFCSRAVILLQVQSKLKSSAVLIFGPNQVGGHQIMTKGFSEQKLTLQVKNGQTRKKAV